MANRPTAYTKDEILSASSGALFGPQGPQLPAPGMLMLDTIDELFDTGGRYGKGVVRATLNIRPDLWFFESHFPGDPVMPGCLGLDALWQLLGFYLGWLGQKGRGRALGVGELKFSGQILPNAGQIHYELHVKRLVARKVTIGLADGVVKLGEKAIYHATDLKVGLFTDTSQF